MIIIQTVILATKRREDKFKEAASAYKVLSDSEQRARYDQFGHQGFQSNGDPFSGFGDINDIFSAFGDLFGGRMRQRGPLPGEDIHVRLTIDFKEAVTGVKKTIRIARNETCSTCDGSGAARGTSVTQCTRCKGQGQILHAQGFFSVQTVCPNCRGSGDIIESPCASCRGSGVTKKEAPVDLTIPAGIDDGQTLRLAGKGHASLEGGADGYLYVSIRVREDRRFVREGDDVSTEIPIGIVTAVLGGTVKVPILQDHVTGEKEIEVSAGTQTGDTRVLRGEGFPRLQRKGNGNHIIRFVVKIPKNINKKSREMLQSLAEDIDKEYVKPTKRGIFSGK